MAGDGVDGGSVFVDLKVDTSQAGREVTSFQRRKLVLEAQIKLREEKLKASLGV